MSEYRFETEGTQEWLCAKTHAPRLPDQLCYRIRMKRFTEGSAIVVAIVDPNRRKWNGRKGKVLAYRWENVYAYTEDWREVIGKCAEQAYDAMDFARAKDKAKGKDHPFFGTFCNGSDQ